MHYMLRHIAHLDIFILKHHIQCTRCGYRTLDFESKEETLAVWNKRTHQINNTIYSRAAE